MIRFLMNSSAARLRLWFSSRFKQNGPPRRRRHTGSCLVLSLALLISGISVVHGQEVQVIANPTVKVIGLSQLELRAIYISRVKHWEDGSEIIVFVMPQHAPIHQQFAKSVLKTLPHQLQAVWNRMFYSGMGQPPVEVPNEQEMIERVSRTPGAIGYTGNPIDVTNVQVIQVETLL